MDKVEKIRNKIERLHGNPYYMMAIKDVLSIIDSLQEEPMVSAAESLGMTQEQYSKAVDELFYGGEVSEEMESEFLRAANNLKEQPTLHDWFRHFYLLGKQHQKYNPFDSHIQVGDKITVNEDGSRFNRSQLDRAIAKQEEPVSENLEDITQTITYEGEVYTRCYKDKLDAFACKYPMLVPKPPKRYAKYSDVDLTIAVKEGAQWQKEQIMKYAIEREVKEDAGGYPYIDATELYDYENDKPLAKAGDKIKVVFIKDK